MIGEAVLLGVEVDMSVLESWNRAAVNAAA